MSILKTLFGKTEEQEITTPVIDSQSEFLKFAKKEFNSDTFQQKLFNYKCYCRNNFIVITAYAARFGIISDSEVIQLWEYINQWYLDNIEQINEYERQTALQLAALEIEIKNQKIKELEPLTEKQLLIEILLELKEKK